MHNSYKLMYRYVCQYVEMYVEVMYICICTIYMQSGFYSYLPVSIYMLMCVHGEYKNTAFPRDM